MSRNARAVAYRVLQRIDHDHAYANVVLARALPDSGLDQRDRAFVTDLVCGTTRQRRACDFLIDRFLVKEPAPEVRTLLRLGAYQLAFGGVEPHAAVSATVELAPKWVRPFVNAVLRNVARTPAAWPDEPTRLSYPDWIVARLTSELGRDEARVALETMNRPPPVTVRADGYVQDRASTWVADLVDAQPGERVADLCAAPGGKATRMSTWAGTVVAADLHRGRARLVKANAAQLERHNLAVVVADSVHPPFASASFDRVLLDVPCSGLGALRRRPDARWRIAPGDVERLARLQQQMVDAAAVLVRPGGVLVYSVCTLTAAESIDLDFPDGWSALSPPDAPWRPYGDGARLLPQDADTDGMVVLRYRRPS